VPLLNSAVSKKLIRQNSGCPREAHLVSRLGICLAVLLLLADESHGFHVTADTSHGFHTGADRSQRFNTQADVGQRSLVQAGVMPWFQVPADDGEGFPAQAGQRLCVPAIVENVSSCADQCVLANYFFAGLTLLLAWHRYFCYSFAHTGRPRQDVWSSKINMLRNWVRKGYLTKQGSLKVQIVPFIVLSQEIYVDFLPRVRLKSSARNRILTNFKTRVVNKLEMEIKPRVKLKKVVFHF
jgi:hypothetical protein